MKLIYTYCGKKGLASEEFVRDCDGLFTLSVQLTSREMGSEQAGNPLPHLPLISGPQLCAKKGPCSI